MPRPPWSGQANSAQADHTATRSASGRTVPCIIGSPGRGAVLHVPAGSEQVLTTSRDNTLAVWDAKQGLDIVTTIGHNNNTGRWVVPFRASWGPAGDALMCGSMDRQVRPALCSTGPCYMCLARSACSEACCLVRSMVCACIPDRTGHGLKLSPRNCTDYRSAAHSIIRPCKLRCIRQRADDCMWQASEAHLDVVLGGCQ